MMKFNQKQIKKLAENTNVLQVLEDRIFYTPELKLKNFRLKCQTCATLCQNP